MQSKKASLIESIVNQLVGYVVALLAQLILFPLYGIEVSISQNIQLVLWFALISTIRTYVFRRLFNKLHTKGLLK